MGRITAAWAGVCAATLGVATGHAVAAWSSLPDASPVPVIASAVVDLTPPAVKRWAETTFGTADKAALLSVEGLAILALAAATGLLAARRPAAARWVMAGFGLLGVLGVLAALSRPGLPPLGALPSAVAALVATLALHRLLRTRPAPATFASPMSSPATSASPMSSPATSPPSTSPPATSASAGPDRRTVLLGGAASLLGAGAMAALAGGRPTPTLPVTLPPPPTPLPSGPAGLESLLPGITPLRTPIPDFYRIDISFAPPNLDPASWRLDVRGMVAHPFTLAWDELLALPMIERDITLTCVSNPIGGPLCGSTRWRGVRVADLIRRAGPLPGADMVLSEGADGFTAGTPLENLLDGRDALIAIAMDGQPLTQTHGAPARLLTPGLYGYVGATKWLTGLLVTTFAERKAYWTLNGWAERAPVKTATRIDVPRGQVRAGDVLVGGVAWATHRGISRVEVQVDGGPWREATLGPDIGRDYWRQWYLRWPAAAGTHSLAARAYDGAGVVQTAQLQDVAPDGATGYATATVRVD